MSLLRRGEMCKHLWAVLGAADAGGILSEARPDRIVALVSVFDDEVDDWNDPDEDEHENDEVVEMEKVIELQDTKRQLADAIITEDNSVLAKLSRKELELLLT